LLKNKKNYSPELNLDLIPAKNKVIVINQKHNLRTGGISKQITDKKIINELETIIKKIVKIFDIHFCSIDFALVKNKFVVVEINGGVMFEKFSQTSKQNYEKCKEIYAKAIDSYLDK
jgi:glutathione synthase/RimK-type ligase-like ATP-grasp enzyme